METRTRYAGCRLVSCRHAGQEGEKRQRFAGRRRCLPAVPTERTRGRDLKPPTRRRSEPVEALPFRSSPPPPPGLLHLLLYRHGTPSTMPRLRVQAMAQRAHERPGDLQRGACPPGTAAATRGARDSESEPTVSVCVCRTTGARSRRAESSAPTRCTSGRSSPGARSASRRARRTPNVRVLPRLCPCLSFSKRGRLRVRMRLTVRSVYHGARAQYHYFQCLQLLLRKQVAVLMRLWDLPPEFEVRFGIYSPVLENNNVVAGVTAGCMQRRLDTASQLPSRSAPARAVASRARHRRKASSQSTND